MQTLKNAIPNSFTLANLACGLLGILWAFEGKLAEAAYLIWLAAAFDFFDGFLARMLKATTEIGKQLDSLADLVTFGVLPSFLFYHMLKEDLPTPFIYLTFATALLSALRLAKFNIDDDQKTEFKGLTTTANGIFTSSIPLILASDSFFSPIFSQPWALFAACLVFSLLLVTPVTLFSLKFSNFKWGDNQTRFIFIAVSGVLFVTLWYNAIPLIIVSYILLSILENINKK